MWSKCLNANVKPLKMNTNRICAVKLETAQLSIVIACVYFPNDNYSNTYATDELLFELSQLDALLTDSVYQHVLIGGDFNTDFGRNNAQSLQVTQFMERWGLLAVRMGKSSFLSKAYIFIL